MSVIADDLELIATAAFGVEASVKWELRRLDCEPSVISPGRISFKGGADAIARTNIALRTADRVLVVMGRFSSTDFDDLFAGVRAIDWKAWLPARPQLNVRVGAVRSEMKSPRSAQGVVKRAIVESLVGAGNTLEETGPQVDIDVSVIGSDVTIALDASGKGLHKRGYRTQTRPGQLKETLAAALVMTCRWRRDQPLIDPFCGSATIAIEAALLASGRAPGRTRSFAAESWPWMDQSVWQRERERAEAQVDDSGIAPILASDINPQAVGLARRCAEAAGVGHLVDVQLRDYRELSSELERGWIITNPPYGERVGERKDALRIQRDLPDVLSRFPTWSFGLLLGGDDFESIIGNEASRRRKLYNAKIRCTFYQFEPAMTESRAFTDAVSDSAMESFQRAFEKMVRHSRRWPERHATNAYRVFTGEVQGRPFAVERYGESARVEFSTKVGLRPSAHELNLLNAVVERVAAVTGIPLSDVHSVHATQPAGRSQVPVIVHEGDLNFETKPGEPDTGFEPSLRELRSWVRRRAEGKGVLDLHAVPGRCVEVEGVYARHITAITPDEHALAALKRNLQRNSVELSKLDLRILSASHSTNEDDAFDLITCVTSKQPGESMLDMIDNHLAPGGSAVVACPASAAADHFVPELPGEIRELTRSLTPEDFRGSMMWRIWCCRVPGD